MTAAQNTQDFGVLSEIAGKTARSRKGQDWSANGPGAARRKRCRNHKILESLTETWGKWPVSTQDRPGQANDQLAPRSAARIHKILAFLAKTWEN